MDYKNDNLIVNFAPTGMIPTKEQTQYVPIAPAEVIDDVLEAWEHGITMVHLHARNPQTGGPDYRKELYAEMIEGIRRHAPELVICVSLCSRTHNDISKRSEVLELTGNLKPDMGSLTLSSLNFNKQASMNSPETILALASKMKEAKIKPELESFDSGMINYAHYLIRKGLLTPPYYFNLLFGNIACAQANLLHVGIMERDVPVDSYYSFAGVGSFQQKISSIAIASGAGVRIGLEDNIWYDQGKTKLARNIDLVKRVHRIAEENDRKLMTSAELRTLLDLRNGLDEGYGMK